jgi:small nuclear ribonucleoprotein (snRNP)-like protein
MHVFRCLTHLLNCTLVSLAVSGVLKGYDQLVNIVLDDTKEFMRGSFVSQRVGLFLALSFRRSTTYYAFLSLCSHASETSRSSLILFAPSLPGFTHPLRDAKQTQKIRTRSTARRATSA